MTYMRLAENSELPVLLDARKINTDDAARIAEHARLGFVSQFDNVDLEHTQSEDLILLVDDLTKAKLSGRRLAHLVSAILPRFKAVLLSAPSFFRLQMISDREMASAFSPIKWLQNSRRWATTKV